MVNRQAKPVPLGVVLVFVGGGVGWATLYLLGTVAAKTAVAPER